MSGYKKNGMNHKQGSLRGFVTDFYGPIWVMGFHVCAHHGGTSEDTDLANSKETQSLRKNGCRQRYLDKSLTPICRTIKGQKRMSFLPPKSKFLRNCFYFNLQFVSSNIYCSLFREI